MARPEPSLDAIARSKGLRFGTGLGIGMPGSLPSLNDAAYRAPVPAERSIITPKEMRRLPPFDEI